MATECVFDGAPLKSVDGKEGTLILLRMMVSPSSTMFNLAKASLRSNVNGSVKECPDCGWVAIFSKKT